MCRHIVLADWKPQGVQEVIAYSAWSWVGLMNDGRSVLKYPRLEHDEQALQTLYDEAARYDHVGPHDNLVVFKGKHDYGLLFEYCEKGSLADVIQYQQPPLGDHEKITIAQQITRCLLHLHAKNLIHGDISVRNVFITAANVAKVGDLQANSTAPTARRSHMLASPTRTHNLATQTQVRTSSRYVLTSSPWAPFYTVCGMDICLFPTFMSSIRGKKYRRDIDGASFRFLSHMQRVSTGSSANAGIRNTSGCLYKLDSG